MSEPGLITSDESRSARPVFVSFATVDRKEALAVCKAIERRGTHCWISIRDVAPGENYQEEIVRAIRDGRAVVLVFSRAANNSDEIKKELSLASRYHVPVIALRIEDVEPSDAFAYELSTRQWIDVFEGWDSSIDVLVKKLEQVAPARDIRDVPARTGGSHRAVIRRWSTRRMVAGGVALLIVVVAGALTWNATYAKQALTVQIADFQPLGVATDVPIAFQQELRAAFGDDNAVAVKDKGATFVLGGSIRRMGDKDQFSIQLTDSKTGEMVWSAETDSASGALAPQQVAQLVVYVVRCGLADAMEYPGKLSDRALSLYLQHCRITAWNDVGGPDRALDVIRKVVELAPDFSKAWSELAIDAASAAQAVSPTSRATLIESGADAARRALKLDPRNGLAYVALAELQPRHAWAQREKLYRRAVEVRVSDCGCEHQQFGAFLLEIGRDTDAAVEYGRALDMQPNSPEVMRGLVSANYAKGDIERGDKTMSDFVGYWKGLPRVDRLQLIQSVTTKRWEQAYGRAKEMFADPAQAPLAEAFATLASHDSRRVDAVRVAILHMPDEVDTFAFRAFALAQLGARKDAMALIKPEYDTGEGEPAFLFSPALAPLREDPEWIAILKKLGLISYWHASKMPPDFCKATNAPSICRTI